MRRLLPLILFLSVAYPHKQYNIEGIIERDSSYYKKFSDEIVNGNVYQMFDDMKILLGKIKKGKKNGKWNGRAKFSRADSAETMQISFYAPRQKMRNLPGRNCRR